MSYLSCLKVIKVKCVFYCRSISILYTNVLVPFIMYLLEILTALFVLFFYLNAMLSGEKGSLSSYFWREFSAFERCSINSPRDRERYRRGIARVGSLSPPSLLLCCKWWMSSTLLICPGLVGSATRRLIHTSSFPLLTAMPDKKIFTKSRGRNILLLTN